ncbi:AAA family ATPase [Spirosoma rhododendri]|uniref:AAA family ATPase n=1 Tax=Spirosoma rhododendri TaxID=2728024 RepID=A0A7L5DVA9_9BACT|nr:AAA family ATPase [Spirosoma rhododendri]QJD81542.1 AAA family ATPase [Spirosoma rhododendri]
MMPSCYVIAGPNGAGKSTAAYALIPAGVEQINPDDIARQLRQHLAQQEVVLQQTNDEARRRMDAHSARRESFSVETNLYDEATWQYFMAQQRRGYGFTLLFLCTSQLTTLVERVVNRCQQGGHFVREDVIRERYVKGLYWLNRFFDQPDSLILFDTSHGPLNPVYKRVGGVVEQQADPLPDWVVQHLGRHFGVNTNVSAPSVRSAASVDEVRNLYDRLKGKPPTSS